MIGHMQECSCLSRWPHVFEQYSVARHPWHEIVARCWHHGATHGGWPPRASGVRSRFDEGLVTGG